LPIGSNFVGLTWLSTSDSGEPVIASADLLDWLVLPPGVAARSLGPIRLRGKEQAMELCVLTAA
jgi:hypothetical protein